MIVQTFPNFRAIFSVSGTKGTDGHEGWPVQNPAFNGFLSATTGIVEWDVSYSLPLTISVNAGANDAVLGTDEYDWYVSQKTDDPTKQYLSAAQPAAKSGTLTLGLTALGDTTFPSLDESSVQRLFTNVTIYVQRRLGRAIRTLHMYEGAFPLAT